jgi:hypothetical protein
MQGVPCAGHDDSKKNIEIQLLIGVQSVSVGNRSKLKL